MIDKIYGRVRILSESRVIFDRSNLVVFSGYSHFLEALSCFFTPSVSSDSYLRIVWEYSRPNIPLLEKDQIDTTFPYAECTNVHVVGVDGGILTIEGDIDMVHPFQGHSGFSDLCLMVDGILFADVELDVFFTISGVYRIFWEFSLNPFDIRIFSRPFDIEFK